MRRGDVRPRRLNLRLNQQRRMMVTGKDAGSAREKTIVSVTRCDSYDVDVLAGAIARALEPFGGIGSFVGKGQRVLLKPNLLSAKDPARAITTHPNFIEAVAGLVRSKGAIPFVGDSPGGAIRGIQRVWNNTGMAAMAERAGLELANFEASGFEEIRSGKYRLHVAKRVLEADVVINLAKFKTHSLTLLTCGVKNMFGVIPGFRKAEFHKLYPKPEEFSEMLVEIYGRIRPALTIVDGILAMEGNGPSSGKPRQVGLVFAGPDAVAIDAVAADVAGFGENQIATTRIAGRKGVGAARLEDIEQVGDGVGLKPEGFLLPSNRGLRLIPRPLARMVAPLVWLKLEIDKEGCTRCAFCLNSCPVGAIIDEGGAMKIRQKMCVQCMCCHELCPENAIDIKMSLLARLFL